MKTKRNSNIEILRILSIVMIVLSHYTVHNNVENYTLPLGINRYILEISTLGNLGTIIFILITGYYLSRSGEGVYLNKILKFYLNVLFYSLGIYLILILLNIEIFSFKTFISCLLPISFQSYWFASAYFILYIFHPYINKLLNNLTQKEHLNFIFLGVTFFSILSTLTTKKYYGNELIQFILFYSIGAYISKYNDNYISKNNTKLLIISIFILLASVLFFDILGTKCIFFAKHSTYLFSRTSFVAILFSVSLFSIFASRKTFSNKFINTISSCVFGVYLISDNKFIRKILWTNILKNSDYVMSNYLLLHMILSLILVFTICIIIEYIRINTIDKLPDKYIAKIINKKLQIKTRFIDKT